MDKDINKIKLAITTNCNLGCEYCFVKKTNENMDFNTAKHAIDLLLRCGGKDKLLSIYGGEPLLNFKLIEEICPYALSRAEKLHKNLIITICTNFTTLNEKNLLFLKKYNIRLIISMVGEKKYHNRVRNFNNNNGSYDLIVKKLPLLFKIIPQENLGASFCIFPSMVNSLENNFKHLIGLGFNYINFEIIREYERWSLNRIERFVPELNKVIIYIFSCIPKENFIFLNPINWEIKYRVLTQSLKMSCPFNYKLEVYPNGEMAFSPFLLNSPYRDNYIIGNINEPTLKRFDSCRFDYSSSKCRRCEYNYFKDYGFDEDASKVYNLYQIICMQTAKLIENYAHKSSPFYSYVQRIRKTCF